MSNVKNIEDLLMRARSWNESWSTYHGGNKSKPIDVSEFAEELSKEFSVDKSLIPDEVNTKEEFHEYMKIIGKEFTFGDALSYLKHGAKVARKGWNGKGMFIALQLGTEIINEQARGGAALELAKTLGPGEKIIINPHFSIKNVDNSVSTWVPSVNDCLAEDWIIV